eukprot:scaffold68348_cov28-Phaeocystis_antarctica.AAC.1
MKVPTALRAQILRTARPARSLLGVPRPIASKETCRRWARESPASRAVACRFCLRARFVCAPKNSDPRATPPHPTQGS